MREEIRRIQKELGITTIYVTDDQEDASINLGVPPILSFIRVVLPIMMPGIAAGAIIMWVTTLAELSSTIVLWPMGHDDHRDLPAHRKRRLRTGLRICHNPDHLRPDLPFHPEPGLGERPGILPIDFIRLYPVFFLEGSPGVGLKAPGYTSS